MVSEKSLFHAHVDMLRHNLISSVKNVPNQMFVHLSHDDLDGYGCTVVSYIEQWLHQTSIMRRKSIPTIVSTNYITKNTNRINSAVYQEIDMLMQEAMVTAHHRRINFLITDIGGIEIQQLIDRYRNCNAGDIYFMIIDHHRSVYQTMPNGMIENGPYNGAYVHHDRDGNTIVSYRSGYSFGISMYITNGKRSATKAMFDLIKTNKESPIFEEFADTVSRYDTGDVGNWIIPENVDDLDTYYASKISNQVKLNSWWKCSHQERSDHVKSMHRFVHELASCIVTSMTYCTMRQEIRNRIVQINADYIKFCENCEIIDRRPGQRLLIGCGQSLIIPENMDHVTRFSIYWYDDPKETYPALTLYSAVYLKEHPDVDVLLVANDVRKTIDTRSERDNVNVYEICKANGGGGHPHAAGCPMK